MLSYCTHTGTKVCTFTFNSLKGFSACKIVMPEPELLKLRSFGRTSLREVKRKLLDIDLDLGMELPEGYSIQGS